MLELLTSFVPSDIEESDCCVELQAIALTPTCVLREYGTLCFPEKVLKEKAKDLIGKPVLLDHKWEIDKVVGVVVDAHYDEEKKAIVVKLRFPKDGNERLISLLKMSPPPVKSLSIGGIVKTKKENGKFTVQDIEFKEVSLVFEGADPKAKRLAEAKLSKKESLGVQNWWDDPELRKKAPREYFLDPVNRKYPYRTWDGEISCDRLRAIMSLASLHGETRIYARAKTLYENNCRR